VFRGEVYVAVRDDVDFKDILDSLYHDLETWVKAVKRRYLGTLTLLEVCHGSWKSYALLIEDEKDGMDEG
jgi:hypothetical protein